MQQTDVTLVNVQIVNHAINRRDFS